MQIHFNSRSFDPTTRLLSHDGQSIRLRPKTARLLNCLLEQPLNLRRKDELIEAIWGHSKMDDQALHQIIRNLRQSVGDPDCLMTHPAQGYQWVWEVQHQTDSSSAIEPSLPETVSTWRLAWLPTAALLVLIIATTLPRFLLEVPRPPSTSPGETVVSSPIALTSQFQRIQSVMLHRQQGDEASALAGLLDWQAVDSDNIELMIEIAHSYQQLDQLSLAQQAATDALSMAREQSSAGNEVLAGLILSQMQYQQGLTDAAMTSVQRSGQLASELGLACAIKLIEDWQVAIQRHDWQPEAITDTLTRVASNLARCSFKLDKPLVSTG